MDTGKNDSAADVNRNLSPIIFKQYEDGFTVRRMTRDDAKIVQKWYTTLGNGSIYDLDVCLDIVPPGPGFYIGELNGEVVASCIRIPWCNTIYFGSYYYVKEGHRRKGYGTRLRDEVAFGHVGKNTLCIDAVGGKVAETNEAKFGYKTVWITRRLEWTASSETDVKGFQGSIIKAEDHSFEEVMQYDNKCFVTKDSPTRGKFMKRWTALPHGAACVALDPSGAVIGLGCRRQCIQENSHMVGPLYANDATIAEALLRRLCADVTGHSITIDTWVPNEAAISLFERMGMKLVFDLHHQQANGPLDEYKPEIFSVTSVDICGF